MAIIRPPVLMLEPGGWGGICHYTFNLCEALQDSGMPVVLISGKDYELADMPRRFHLEACLDAFGSYLGNLRTIRSLMHVHRPDIVHVQATLSARRDWVALMLCRGYGLPPVLTVHNVFPHDRQERNARGMRTALRRLYGTSRALIAHGEAVRRELLGSFPIDPGRVHNIPHGDYGFANRGNTIPRSEARDRLGLPADVPVALAFGAIREYKGIHLLIPAFARVREHLPDARLMIVGKPVGSDPNVYRELIETHALGDRVLFRPEYVPFADIGLYFAAADVAVYPYLKVYQSGALQLAYAFARPVVATDVGALSETVEDGVNGRMVPPGDIQALARALCELLSAGPEALDRMGQRSADLADSRYGWDKIAESTLQIYSRVISEARGA